MTLAALKERLEPHLSVRIFGLTLGALLGATVLGTGVMALVSGGNKIDASVTIPLGADNTVEDMTGQVTAGTLNDSDLGVTEPGVPPTTQPAQKPKAVIEDAVAGLHENTPFGLVPIIRKDDKLTPFKAYSAAFEPAANTKALISLVMVDYGLSKTTSESAIKSLPDGVTFALSPYSSAAQKLTTAARQDGHEVWLGLPMQGVSFGINDSGNQTLLVNAGLDQNKNRLLTNLGVATGYAGVIDLDSPAFGDAAADLDSIYSTITDRGLALAQANPKDTLTGGFATARKVPFIQNDLWIDKEVTTEGVTAELNKLQEIAMNGDVAVGFFHPYPAVIDAIRNWQGHLATEQIQLAPLSASINQKSN